jgi:hypothetical protein
MIQQLPAGGAESVENPSAISVEGSIKMVDGSMVIQGPTNTAIETQTDLNTGLKMKLRRSKHS